MPEEEVGPIKKGFGLLGLRTPKVNSSLLVCLSCRMCLFKRHIFPGAVELLCVELVVYCVVILFSTSLTQSFLRKKPVGTTSCFVMLDCLGLR